MVFKRKTATVIAYCVIWAVSILTFWITPLCDDPMAYSLIVLYLLLPISTVILSFFIGCNEQWGRRKWGIPVFLGVMYMLAEYLTFSLANMLAFSKINTPELTMLLLGLILSLVAMVVGFLVQKRRRRQDTA